MLVIQILYTIIITVYFLINRIYNHILAAPEHHICEHYWKRIQKFQGIKHTHIKKMHRTHNRTLLKFPTTKIAYLR